MRLKKTGWNNVGLILVVVLALVSLVSAFLGNRLASLPVPMPQEFVGEYSYDQENWFPLQEESELSALEGDVTLRGHFLREMQEGWQLNFYRNHVGVSISVNGEKIYTDVIISIPDIENRLFSLMCGQGWSKCITPDISEEDQVEISLHNPHKFGNETAYHDFLETMCVDSPGMVFLQKNLEQYGEPFRLVGSLFVIISILLLGAAITSVAVRVPVGGKLLLFGLLFLFAGGFFIFDTLDVSLWNEITMLNTYANQLLMMLAVLCFGVIVAEGLDGKRKKTVKIAVTVSALFNSVLIGLSILNIVPIYDTLPYWVASQLILCPMLVVCCALQLRVSRKKKVLIPISGIAVSGAILLDIAGVGASIVWRNPCSKLVFAALFVICVIAAAKEIIENHFDSLRAVRLEKELEDNRIAIMLSQIQPHFLYNALTAVMDLCDSDPQQAKEAVADFSHYLRGNLSALTRKESIPFSKELEHIETYLRLEKLRFCDRLTVEYSIETDAFWIPALSIQPLVENAIKHGIMKKPEGGTVRISTWEDDSFFHVEVSDNGIGFDQKEIDTDGKLHVGLENIRGRLGMAEANLLINSIKGIGTTAEVIIKKREGQ